MKTSTLTTIIYLISTFFCSATSYYTLSSGDWNDMTIWSTDGISKCNCVPASPTTALSIDINHAVVGIGDLYIDNGTKINISPAGSLFAPYSVLTINSGEFNADNDVRYKKVIVNPGAKLTINNNLMFMYNQMVIYGTVEFDNAELFILLGNWNVYAPGKLYMRNNSVIRLAGGNYNNFGLTNLEAGSMIYACAGNVNNYEGGIFSGAGGVYTVGTIKNFKGGSWASTLVFCAGGEITGISGPEDCTIAPAECYIVPLSVTLVSFDGIGRDGVNELKWTIGEEVSVKSYVLEKSIDGNVWKYLTEVEADGLENRVKIYNYTDARVTNEVSYYRLTVKDEENNTMKEDYISVRNRMDTEVSVYPNPFTTSCKLNFGNSNYHSIEIMDLTGKVIFESAVSGKSFELSIDEPVGVYLLKLKGQDEKIIRLIKK